MWSSSASSSSPGKAERRPAAELVGLMPSSVASAAAGSALRLPAMTADRMLEVSVLGEFGE